jgi:hypothetical protein
MKCSFVAIGSRCLTYIGCLTILFWLIALFWALSPVAAEQISIPAIEQIPRKPEPFLLRDWYATAQQFDQLAFDTTAEGQYLPLIEIEKTSTGPRFRMSAYVGDNRLDQSGRRPAEAISSIGAVLGATFVGIDKSGEPYNWVRMCNHFFARRTEQRVFVNKFSASTGDSFWYDLFPGILVTALADRYPCEQVLAQSVHLNSQRWLEATRVLTDDGRNPNFRFTAFDFATMKPVVNGLWVEPDAAAGIAWLHYMAYLRTHDNNPGKAERFLQSTSWCLGFLEKEPANPAYEVLIPFGAYTAARVNAEQHGTYDIAKFVGWCFQRSEARPDMIMIADRWANQDVHGLLGFTKPGDPSRGYAFTMNTFAAAWPLVPLVRYDDRFARAIGRWMLGAANAARYFYPDAHPESRQSSYRDGIHTKNVVAYEGIRNMWLQDHPEEKLFAAGDPLTYGWGPHTDLSLYGSAFVGVFGAMVRPTNHERILQLDLRATDSCSGPSYPSYLFYNPYPQSKEIVLPVASNPQDLYDCVSNRVLVRNVLGSARFQVPPDEAVLLVLIPSAAKRSWQGSQLIADGIVVDYRND